MLIYEGGGGDVRLLSSEDGALNWHLLDISGHLWIASVDDIRPSSWFMR
jgi:hypothetical protein